MVLNISGLYPPIPTPFTETGAVDYARLSSNLSVWNKFGLAGYVVQGSNGEVVYLSEDERVEVVKAVRQNTNKLIIAGAGCESTIQTIRLCKRMAAAGADAVLVINPHYYTKGMKSEAVITNHFKQVADASPIPVVLYNMPANTGIEIPNSCIVELAAHPNIIGMKDSGGKVAKMAYVMQECGPDFQCLAGSASFLAPAMCLGAVGGVCALANIAPAKVLQMMDMVRSGDIAGAMALQKTLVEPNTAVTAGFGIPGLKSALDYLGMQGGYLRSPLLPLPNDKVQKLRQILIKAGITSVPGQLSLRARM